MGTDWILIIMGVGSETAVRWNRMLSGRIRMLGIMLAMNFMIGWIELLLLGTLDVDIQFGPVA